jgi:hypothetical protein
MTCIKSRCSREPIRIPGRHKLALVMGHALTGR